MMKIISLLLSIAGLCLYQGAEAFAPTTSVGLGHVSSTHQPRVSTTAVHAMDAAMISEMETARAAFVLCLAGALGTAAVGREGEYEDMRDDSSKFLRKLQWKHFLIKEFLTDRCGLSFSLCRRSMNYILSNRIIVSVIPVTIREWKKVNALKGQGYSSRSGEQLDLFGYPEPVYSDDVMTIINNNMTVYDMVSEYPIEGQLPGYLRFESLAMANAEISQVAVRAVFDSIAVGVNKNSVAPSIAAEKLELYKREGLEMMTKNSRLSKTIGVLALVILLSLLGAADYFALYHLFKGWFPEWSGSAGMPLSLLDFSAYSSLPSCFMNDVPPMPIESGAFPMN